MFPRLSEYSPEREALDDVVDRLGEVVQAIVASGGVKPHKIKPRPRPRTARDRLRGSKALTDHRKLVARVLPQQ